MKTNHRMSWTRALFALALIAMLSGCAHSMRGGPKNALDVAVTPETTGETAADLFAAKDKETRNSVLEIRMMMIDRGYNDYVAAINRERTRSKLGTQLGELLLSIGGTVTGSPAERKTFAAATSLIKGGDAIVDSTVFYEQTIVALVSAMDANRARIRLRINSSMNSELSQYTRSQAYQDLQDYANAGTLLGALRYVQAQAEADKKNSELQIDSNVRQMRVLTAPERSVRICATDALAATNSNRTHANMVAAANALGVKLDGAVANDDQQIARALQTTITHASDAATYAKIDAAFKSASLYPNDSSCK